MTLEEATEKMRACIPNVDQELAHIDADDVLCAFLTTLGYVELVDLYHQVAKWYA